MKANLPQPIKTKFPLFAMETEYDSSQFRLLSWLMYASQKNNALKKSGQGKTKLEISRKYLEI